MSPLLVSELAQSMTLLILGGVSAGLGDAKVDLVEFSLVFVIVLVAGVMHGSVGFGFSVIATPLLSFLLPLRMTIAITVFFIIAYSLQIVYRFRKFIPWRAIAVPLVASIIARVFGVVLLMNLNIGVLRMAWGSSLILLAAYFMAFRNRIRIKPSLAGGIVAGTLSGLFGGMFNTAGPALVVYFFNAFKEKRQYSAALQVTFFMGALASLFVHLAYGNITLQVLRFVGVGITGVLVGIFVGIRIFEKLAKRHLNILVYLVMALMGIVQIMKAI